MIDWEFLDATLNSPLFVILKLMVDKETPPHGVQSNGDPECGWHSIDPYPAFTGTMAMELRAPAGPNTRTFVRLELCKKI